MKEIMLKIIGRQFEGDETEDRMEFITEGRMYERNGATYLIYEESEFSGFPGCKTSLRLKDDTIRMKRIGGETGFGTEIEFKRGKRFVSKYETPYGVLDMEVVTRKVESNLAEDGTGTVDIEYQVSFDGMAEGRNALRIEVS